MSLVTELDYQRHVPASLGLNNKDQYLWKMYFHGCSMVSELLQTASLAWNIRIGIDNVSYTMSFSFLKIIPGDPAMMVLIWILSGIEWQCSCLISKLCCHTQWRLVVIFFGERQTGHPQPPPNHPHPCAQSGRLVRSSGALWRAACHPGNTQWASRTASPSLALLCVHHRGFRLLPPPASSAVANCNTSPFSHSGKGFQTPFLIGREDNQCENNEYSFAIITQLVG